MTDHILLGGAERTRTRVRGFAPWTPRASTEQLLAQVDLVLAEYVDHLPLTLRQIFYRLVGAHGYEKTELPTSGSANISTAPAVPSAFPWMSSATMAAPSSRLRSGPPPKNSSKP
jgi:hypothetical protein